jgi:hypothetical protein
MPLRAHGVLEPPIDGDELVTASVGPDGAAVALWAAAPDRQRMVAPFGSRSASAKAAARRPAAVRVTVAGRVVSAVVHRVRFPQVQLLPDGAILVASQRGGVAEVFDADGRPLRQGSLLDGIQHVLATASGHLWVGYFDQGVYGDDPVAHHGIVRFTPGLDPDWTYPLDIGVGPVDDCYALNVDGEAAWAYYYSSFPIVCITDGSVTAWRTEVAGATGLLAAADACALLGGYGLADSDRLVIGQLANGRYEIIDELRLTLPGGEPMPTASFVCRGPDLHVFVDRSWYRLALDDIV